MSEDPEKFFFLDKHISGFREMVSSLRIKSLCLLEDHFTKRNKVSDFSLTVLCEIVSSCGMIMASADQMFPVDGSVNGKYEVDPAALLAFTQMIKILMEATASLRVENLELETQ